LHLPSLNPACSTSFHRTTAWLGPAASIRYSKLALTWSLCLFAAALLFAPGDGMFVFGCVVASVAACGAAYWTLRDPRRLRISSTIATGLLLGYGLGSLITVVRVGSAASASEYFSRRSADLCSTLALVMVACTLLLFFATTAERPIGPLLINLGKRTEVPRLVWGALAIVVIALLSGDVGYMGVSVSDNHTIGFLGTFAAWLNPPLSAVTTMAWMQSRTKRERVAYTIAWLLGFFLLIPQGRRIVLYTLFFDVIAARLTGRLNAKKGLLAGALIIALASASTIGFFALRYATWQLGNQRYTLYEAGLGAVKVLRGESGSEPWKLLNENLRERTFIITYLSDLLAASRDTPPLYGEDFQFSMGLAVPSVLWPDKGPLRDEIGCEEVLANPHFGLPPVDMANSILTGGIIDFGIPGALVYPLLGAAAFALLSIGIRRCVPAPVSVFVNFGLLFAAVQAEITIADYVVAVRNTLLFAALLTILMRLPRFRLGRP